MCAEGVADEGQTEVAFQRGRPSQTGQLVEQFVTRLQRRRQTHRQLDMVRLRLLLQVGPDADGGHLDGGVRPLTVGQRSRRRVTAVQVCQQAEQRQEPRQLPGTGRGQYTAILAGRNPDSCRGQTEVSTLQYWQAGTQTAAGDRQRSVHSSTGRQEPRQLPGTGRGLYTAVLAGRNPYSCRRQAEVSTLQYWQAGTQTAAGDRQRSVHSSNGRQEPQQLPGTGRGQYTAVLAGRNPDSCRGQAEVSTLQYWQAGTQTAAGDRQRSVHSSTGRQEPRQLPGTGRGLYTAALGGRNPDSCRGQAEVSTQQYWQAGTQTAAGDRQRSVHSSTGRQEPRQLPGTGRGQYTAVLAGRNPDSCRGQTEVSTQQYWQAGTQTAAGDRQRSVHSGTGRREPRQLPGTGRGQYTAALGGGNPDSCRGQVEVSTQQ